ncbi:hypothetical protein DITRI_Ditri04bG0084700 [Diplodiscus trichospermus]
MAEIAVSFLLEKLTSFLQNKVELLQGVLKDLEYIKGELESMKAVLRVSNFRLGRETKNTSLASDCSQDLHHQMQNHNISTKCPTYENNSTNEQGPSSIATFNPWPQDRREDALLLDGVDLVGIDEPKKQLINWLVEGHSVSKVVSVVGMGRSEKTTLVKQVNDDVHVKKHFVVRVWIFISHPFKIEELLRNMVRQLFDATRQAMPQGLDDMSATFLKMVIKAFLQ